MTHAETRLPGPVMRGPPLRIGGFIKIQSEPRGIAAYTVADRCRVLANAAGENQRVESA